MLEILDLTTGYGDVPVLSNVSITIREGEFVALLGSNNAGKSTLVNCISGLVPVMRGKKMFLGEDITALPPHEIVERKIIQVPEGRQIFPKMTVYENLLMGGLLLPKPERERAVRTVYDLFPRLEERSSQKAGTMSGGERQMLAIGRALMAKPKLLVLDEPSLGLAPLIVDDIFKTLVQLHRQGLTLLLVEQNLNLSLEVAERGYILENGRLVLQGTSEELMGDARTRKAYLGI